MCVRRPMLSCHRYGTRNHQHIWQFAGNLTRRLLIEPDVVQGCESNISMHMVGRQFVWRRTECRAVHWLGLQRDFHTLCCKGCSSYSCVIHTLKCFPQHQHRCLHRPRLVRRLVAARQHPQVCSPQRGSLPCPHITTM
jgi:hypothetical protein